MVKEVKIPEEIVRDVSDADQKAAGFNDLIQTMVEGHVNDPDDSFVQSAVFQGMLHQYSDARMCFEKAKNEVQQKYIPNVAGYEPNDWNLNYSNGVMTVHYQKVY